MRYAVAVSVDLDDGAFQSGADAIARKKSGLEESVSVGIKLDGYNEFMNEMNKAEKKVPKKGRTVEYTLKLEDKFSKVFTKFNAEAKKAKTTMAALNKSNVIKLKVDFDTKGFGTTATKLEAAKKSLAGDVVVDMKIKGYAMFIKQMETAKRKIPKIKDIKFALLAKDKFTRMFDKLDRRILGSKLLLQELNNTKVDINVESELPELMKDMKGVIQVAKKANKQKVKLEVEVSPFKVAFQEFRNLMARMSTLSRNVGEIISHNLIGSTLTMLPTLVPIIASFGGALGSLLPILGTLGGGIMGIGTSFGLAGAGAVIATALIKSALGDVFKVSEKQRELNKKLANTTDLKERAKIMEELATLQGSLNDGQKKALDSLNGLKDTWGKISTSLAPQSIATFITLMDTLKGTLELLAPTFKSVSDHAGKLADFLNMQLETDDLKAFFEFLGTSAGPALETVGKAVGNFAIGLLNMMTAFGPLATDMQDGLLGMSERFREWTASLSESDKFQSFIKYVQENLPKLGSIFGGFIDGVVGMGEAFAPFTEDMLTGLADMMTKFGEWGQALGENQGFKDFIAYVTENGPKVLDFFGELRDFLVNLGISFSDVGSFMLDFSTALMELGNWIMENNKGLSKFIAWMLVLGAAVLTHLPSFFLFRAILKMIAPVIGTVIGFLLRLIPKMGGVGAVIMRVLPWILRLGMFLLGIATGPIALLIAAVVAVAIAIAMNWDKIWAKTKEIFGAVTDFIDGIVIDSIAAVAKFAVDLVNVFDGIDLYDSGVKIIKSVISGITSMVGAVGKAAGAIAEKISGFFPHSPAKEGALSNLDHLDFQGPVVKSLNRDASGINRAMSKLLVAPELNAGGYAGGGSTYSARSAGYTKQTSPQDMATAMMGGLAIESSDIYMSGEKVGKATWRTVDRNTQRDKARVDRFSGRGTLV
jgi:hypothetical protein